MAGASAIQLQIYTINELLRLPISLYRKRTIEAEAEEFIIEEAEALPRKDALRVNVHLAPSEVQYKEEIAPAIHSHFRHRRLQSQKELKRLMRHGWRVLFIALFILAVIFSLTEIAIWLKPDNRVIHFIRESFIILGWVALWHPMEILLYDWYPVKTEINLYSRLEQSTVHVDIMQS